MLESMDLAIGRILDSLEETKLTQNSLVIFYSDNGGHKATKWLAEKKGSLLEGGLRVPMIATWPKVIKGETTTAEPVTSMDFFPTFVHMAGGDTSDIKQLEGLDLMPLFKGAHQLDRESLFWHYPHNRKGVKYNMGGVILSRDWKYYNGYGVQPDALFNLKDDPMEQKNLIKNNSERAAEMLEKHTAWLTKVGAKMPETP